MGRLRSGYCKVCGSVTFHLVNGEHLCVGCSSWSQLGGSDE